MPETADSGLYHAKQADRNKLVVLSDQEAA